MKRVLVTGATGFIGSAVLSKLHELGYQPQGISRSGGKVGDLQVDGVDCSDQRDLANYCSKRQFDSIIHLAAWVPSDLYGKDGGDSLVQNAGMMMNLLGALRHQSCGHFIYVSSSSVYGSINEACVSEDMPAYPDSFYALGKYVGELICQQFRREIVMPISVLRIPSPYGLGMRENVVSKFIRRALSGEDLTLYGTGNRSQDFVYVKDVANAIVLANKAKADGVFNVSSGVPTTMRELAETILQVVPESKSKIVYAKFDDMQENYRASFSYEKARKAFGYEPMYSIEMGLRETADAMRVP